MVWAAPGTTRPLFLGSRGLEADRVELTRLNLQVARVDDLESERAGLEALHPPVDDRAAGV